MDKDPRTVDFRFNALLSLRVDGISMTQYSQIVALMQRPQNAGKRAPALVILISVLVGMLFFGGGHYLFKHHYITLALYGWVGKQASFAFYNLDAFFVLVVAAIVLLALLVIPIIRRYKKSQRKLYQDQPMLTEGYRLTLCQEGILTERLNELAPCLLPWRQVTAVAATKTLSVVLISPHFFIWLHPDDQGTAQALAIINDYINPAQ